MSKPWDDPSRGISSGDVLIRPERHPACRRREAQPGSCTERENLAGDAKGKGTSGSNREAESTDAPGRGDCPVVVMKRGNARGAKGAGHRVELGPTESNREEPEISAQGGSLRAVARAG